MTSVVEHKRATVRPDKGDAVAELTESFSSSAAAVLTEYRGLTVKQITDLRVALEASRDSVEAFHRHQLRSDETFERNGIVANAEHYVNLSAKYASS